ncbi:hypothetical protein PtB15_17B33 [Puccinia triticina]|nr:hypothetical protein PtB15_17B33 [Puccinia triticina]
MAPVVSTLWRQSHPFFSRALFDITKTLPPVITPGSSYGQLMFESTLAFLNTKTGEDVNMKVKLQVYGSTATSLLEDKIYFLSGRVIALNAKTPPVFYFEQELTFPIADSEGYSISLANKAGCYGFGVVISKAEEKDDSSATSTFNNLLVKIRHTDYDVQTRNSVSFIVQYKVAGNRNLAKTFGLFQVGREVLISGYIAGYNIEQHMLQVNALSVSLSSGYSSSSAAVNAAEPSPVAGNRRRPIQIDFGSDEENGDDAPQVPVGTSDFVQQTPQEDNPAALQTDLASTRETPQAPQKKRKHTKRNTQPTPEKVPALVTDSSIV